MKSCSSSNLLVSYKNEIIFIKTSPLYQLSVSPESDETSPKVIRLCARCRVPYILHTVCFEQTFGSLEGRYPTLLETGIAFYPRLGGTVRVQRELDISPTWANTH